MTVATDATADAETVAAEASNITVAGVLIATASDGSLTLDASQGLSNAGAVSSVGSLTASAGTSVEGVGSWNAGGPLDLSGASGVMAERLNSEGALSVSSSDGAVAVADLEAGGDATVSAAGDVTATRLVTQGSGDLSVASSDGTVSLDAFSAAGSATVTASGEATVSGGSAASGLTVTSNAGDVTVAGDLQGGASLTLNAGEGAVTVATDATADAETISVAAETLSNAGAIIGTERFGTVALTTDSVIDHTGSVDGKGAVSIDAGSINGAGSLQAGGGLSLVLDEGDSVLSGVSAGGALSVSLGSGDLTLGVLSADDGVTLTASDGGVRFQDLVNAGDLLSVNSAGSLTIDSDAVIGAENTVTLSAQSVVNDGAIIAGLTAEGEFTDTGALTITAGVSGGTGLINNRSDIVSGGAMTLRAKSLTNTGTGGVKSGGDMSIAGLSAAPLSVFENQGVLYSQQDVSVQAGSIENYNGAILADAAILLEGIDGAKATQVVNRSSTIETTSGDITIRADRIENRRDTLTTETRLVFDQSYSYTPGLPPRNPPGAGISPEGWEYLLDYQHVVVPHPQRGMDWAMYYDDGPIRVRQYEVSATSTSPASYLFSGGDLTLDGGSILNQYSYIAAEGDIAMTGAALTNEQASLTRDLVLSASNRRFNRCVGGPCRWFLNGGGTQTVESVVYDNIAGSIQAGQSITGSFTGDIDNSTIVEQVETPNLTRANLISNQDRYVATNAAGTGPTFVDPGVMSAIGLNSPTAVETVEPISVNPNAPTKVSVSERVGIDLTELILSTPAGAGLIRPAPPESNYVLENRFAFTNPGAFYSSPYFWDQLNDSVGGGLGSTGETLTNRIAVDDASAARLVETALLMETGSRWLDPSVRSASEQFRSLVDRGIAAARDLQLAPGVWLSAAQIASLTSPIVWYVAVEMNGETVLAPRLYLAGGLELTAEGALIAGASVDLDAAVIANSGDLVSEGDLTLTADGSIVNKSGRMSAEEDLVVSAGDDVVIETETRTRVGRRDDVTVLRGRRASVEAGGALTVIAGDDAVIAGADVSSEDDAAIVAGDDVTVTSVALRQKSSSEDEVNYNRWDSTNHETSRIASGGDVTVSAGGDATLAGASLTAAEDARVAAAGAVTLETVANTFNHNYERAGRKKWGEDRWRTHIATRVSAGGSIQIEAEGGDLLLRAAELEAGERATLSASEGAVALLAAVDLDYHSHHSQSSNAVWSSSGASGHHHETVQMTKITVGDDSGGSSAAISAQGAPDGALVIEAGNGVRVEYRAGGGDLAADLAALSQEPGLEWLDMVAGRDDASWTGIQEVHREWDYKSQGLSGPAAAVVAIAVAAAAGPQFSALVGQAGLSVAASSAIQAGLTTLASRAAVSLINNQGDFGAVLRDLGSSSSLRQLATSIVTAGVTSGLTNGLGLDNSVTAGFAEKLQVQAVRTAVSTAAEAAINGGDLGEQLVNSLVSSAVTLASAPLFEAIGDLEGLDGPLGTIAEGDVTKVLAHAAAGCAVGQASSQNCLAGAVGAGLQELVGGALSDDPRRNTELSGLVGAVAVALAGGDAEAIYTADRVGQMAATFNRQLHSRERRAVKAKVAELAGTDGQSAEEWKERLGREAQRQVNAKQANAAYGGYPEDVVAAQYLNELAAAFEAETGSSSFIDEYGEQLNFLARDDQFYNNGYLAQDIAADAAFYDVVFADYAPPGAESLRAEFSLSELPPSKLLRADALSGGSYRSRVGGDPRRPGLTREQTIARNLALLETGAQAAQLSQELAALQELTDDPAAKNELIWRQMELNDTVRSVAFGINEQVATGVISGAVHTSLQGLAAFNQLALDQFGVVTLQPGAMSRNRERTQAVVDLIVHIDELPERFAAEMNEKLASIRAVEAGDFETAGEILGEVQLAAAALLTGTYGVAGAAGDLAQSISPTANAALAKLAGGRGPEFEALNRGLDDLVSGGSRRLADDVNAEFPDGYSPPYTPGTQVSEFVADGNQTFVRVVSGDTPDGQWIMRASDIEGLSPQQIADRFALPEVPTGITSITPPAGTRIRTGEVNPNFGGSGGATQFQLLDRVSDGWADVTPLE